MRHFVFFLVLFFFPVLSQAAQQQQPLSIQTAKGTVTFIVELVNTPESREVGLMYRSEMAADAGMLFDFAKSGPVSMWMKNTLIPLDMLFIRSDGTIATIAERTVPHSLVPIESGEPVLAVLELNGGVCARLGIREGDKALHPLFGTTQ